MKLRKLHPSTKDIIASLGFIVVAGLLVWAGVFAWNRYFKTAPYVDRERYPVRGIDISSHNGEVNFDEAASDGISFVFIKASEGENFRDTLFNKNYRKARQAGMRIGAYHFFRFDRNGIDQARNVIDAVKGCHLDLGIAVDVESHNNATGVDSVTISQQLMRMTELLNLAGYRVTFYSNLDGYLEYLRQSVPGAPLWICSFRQIAPDMEWSFWQYDHHGKVKGVDGDVDLNAFCGSREDWRRFLEGAVWPYTTPAGAPAKTPPAGRQ